MEFIKQLYSSPWLLTCSIEETASNEGAEYTAVVCFFFDRMRCCLMVGTEKVQDVENPNQDHYSRAVIVKYCTVHWTIERRGAY